MTRFRGTNAERQKRNTNQRIVPPRIVYTSSNDGKILLIFCLLIPRNVRGRRRSPSPPDGRRFAFRRDANDARGTQTPIKSKRRKPRFRDIEQISPSLTINPRKMFTARRLERQIKI